MSLPRTSVSDLNAAKANLMYVVVNINSINIMLRVDTGSTNTFVSEWLVHILGLNVYRFQSYIKVTSQKLKTIVTHS